jgi:hypothetical protein
MLVMQTLPSRYPDGAGVPVRKHPFGVAWEYRLQTDNATVHQRASQFRQVQSTSHGFPPAYITTPKRRAVELELWLAPTHGEIVGQWLCAHGHILALVSQLLTYLCSHFSKPPTLSLY